MKKLSFAQEDLADLGLLRSGLAARETEWEVPEDLAVVDLIELYLEIESALDMNRARQGFGARDGQRPVSGLDDRSASDHAGRQCRVGRESDGDALIEREGRRGSQHVEGAG